MKRYIVRSITAFIAALCLLTASFTAGAAGQPRYIGIARLTPELIISSSGRSNCTATVKLERGYTADVTMKLEYSIDKDTWYQETSWSASGSGIIDINKTYFVSSGYYYRVAVTANVYNNNGQLVENPTKYSPTVKY